MQDESHFSFNEATVLGHLRKQKPSKASSESPSLGNWLEEDERETRLAPVRYKGIITEVSSLHEKSVSKEETLISQESENVSQHLISEKAESGIVSFCSSYVMKKFLEIQEKEIRSLQKIAPQRIHLMEMEKKEKIPHPESQVRPWSEKVISEGKYGLEEKEKEASPFSEVSLLCLRLESRHRFSSQDPQNQLLFRLGVCERRHHQEFIDTIYY